MYGISDLQTKTETPFRFLLPSKRKTDSGTASRRGEGGRPFPFPFATAQEARNLADRIFGMTTLPECALSLYSTEDVFIRFANNGITPSGYRVEHSVSINATSSDRRERPAAS
jgi:hypothetical protein